MSNNKNAKVTAESVAAQAAEENLVVPTVPAQNEKVVTGEAIEETAETPELEVVEGGKKSFKERLVGVTEKLKENKKVVAGVAVSVALAAVAFAKFAAKQAAEETLSEDEADLQVITGENEQALTDAKAESEELAENA
ncbi:hypothetical protein SEA_CHERRYBLOSSOM_48 [Streptomyces phage CherryBlossom]|uniref:Uncharacterized protein n=2 Tax=Rimavirus rima TaxID=2560784 RepID=A0A8F3E4S9_9CAUD|nr:hypothetical protein SEA_CHERRYBLOSSOM_48 [Streptomyces phage CherryBlossom]QWY81447.1 hypothetical protein PET_TAIDAONE_48 [Streptomyces phage TaidaOne]